MDDTEIKDKEPSGAGVRIIDFTELPDSLHEACSVTSLVYLKKQPEYDEAKRRGDLEKAADMVLRLLEGEGGKRAFESLLSKLDKTKPICLLPVINKEKTERVNQIPLALAVELEERLLEALPGTPVSICEGVIRKGGGLTGLGHSDRLAVKGGFTGNITDKSAQHVLVDDNITMGVSLRELMEHVKSQGGDTTAVFVVSTRYTKKLKLDEKLVDRFLREYDIDKEQFKEIMGYGIEKATPGELSALAINPNRFDGVDGLRRIRHKESSEGISEVLQGAVKKKEREKSFKRNSGDEEGMKHLVSLTLITSLISLVLLTSGCFDSHKTRWGMSMKEVSNSGIEQKFDKIDEFTLQGRSTKGSVRCLSWYKFDDKGLAKVTYMLNPGHREESNEYIAFYEDTLRPIKSKFGESLIPQYEFYSEDIPQKVKEKVIHKGTLIMEGYLELRHEFSDKDTIVHTKGFADKVVNPAGAPTDKREFRVEITYEKK